MLLLCCSCCHCIVVVVDLTVVSKTNPTGEVMELSSLVGKLLSVFQDVCMPQLKERWANIALHVSNPHLLHLCAVN